MAKITFITSDDEKIELEGASGLIMELAVNHGVTGIGGDCGGVCSCATCHVHVRPEDISKTGRANDIEADMLDLADNKTEFSRLSCQIPMSENMDGIVLTVAK